ncbi:MAG: RDD family protein [Myxococcota bacterium]|jgi:uncharacterized RDD family membrane protein YckC|nr:RDD family protein [Myxococcota bacterium]
MTSIRPTVDFATPEDVPLSFELAGVGSRILAALLDQLIILTVEIGLLLAALLAGVLGEWISEADIQQVADELSAGGGPTGYLIAISMAAGFVVNFGYYVLLEMVTNGQTLGKRVLGIRVIRDGGYGLTLTASLLRNLARMVDMLPNTYLVGMIVMITHRQEKRLGDMMAGTVVVRERSRSSQGRPFGDQRYSTLTERRFHLDREALASFGEEHEAVLAQFFTRPRLDPQHERRTIWGLSQGFMARMPQAPLFEGDRDRLLFLKELYLALRERREIG